MKVRTGAFSRRTLVNGAAIFGGEAASRLATFMMAALIAHRFGPEALGQYGYAVALASILLLIPDFGLHLLTTRELALARDLLPRYFWNLHWIKLLLVAGVAAFALGFGQWLIHDEGRRLLLYVLVIRAILQSFSQAYMAIFKACEQMHFIASQQILNMLLVILSAVIALELHVSLVLLVSAFLVGQAVETWLGWRIVRSRFSPGPIQGWDGRFLSAMLLAALPIGVTAILQTLNLRLDVLILSFSVSNHELGRFQAAQWFLVGAFLSASLLMSVLFPKLSRLVSMRSEKGTAYVASLLKHCTIVVSAGALALWAGTSDILRCVFGPSFAAASDIVRILAPALPFMFVNTVLFYVFVAAKRRAVYLGALGSGIVLMLYLGFTLAPHYGASGIAVADLIREFTISAILLYFLIRQSLAVSSGLALLKVSTLAAALALTVALARNWGAWVPWSGLWILLMLGGSVAHLGLPNRGEILLLANEGS